MKKSPASQRQADIIRLNPGGEFSEAADWITAYFTRDSTMGRSVSTNVFSKIGKLGLVAVIGLSTALGGCSRVAKKDYDAAKMESSELREKNAQLEQQNRDMASRMTQTEAQIAALQAQQANNGGGANPGNSGWTGGNDGGGNTGGNDGGGSFRRNTDGNMVAELAGDVTFNSGSADLTAAAKKKLDGIAGEIKRKYSGSSIEVQGYSDKNPIKKSKWPSNQALSQARAESVEKYLVGRGISSGRISATGYGSTKLRSSDAKSRRVEIVIQN
ncbi:MAG: OmpA family protein [Phycisphaerales bacterium]